LSHRTVGCERYDLRIDWIPAEPVQKAPDRFDLDPQLKARGYYVDLPHSQIGTSGRRRKRDE
jgi:hypothetical protein